MSVGSLSRSTVRGVVALGLLGLLSSSPAAAARAQERGPLQRFDPAQDVGLDQRLGERVPLELRLRGDDGRELELSELFGERPLVLAFVYYECPMLCNLVLDGAVGALREVALEPGRDYDLLVVSIDPREEPELAAQKKAAYLESFARGRSTPPDPAGWHFLTGEQPALERLTAAAGFRYVFDEAADQYAHAGGLIVLTPEGRLSRYFYGVEFLPRDLRLALVESADGEIGNLVDQFLMLCLHYDPMTGRYGPAIFGALRLAGFATAALLAGYLIVMLRRERRRGTGLAAQPEAGS